MITAVVGLFNGMNQTYNSPGLELCRETFHEETPSVTGMTSSLRPIARTLRSAVAAAINKAICGTKADPVP